jgi:hypothetical protein
MICALWPWSSIGQTLNCSPLPQSQNIKANGPVMYAMSWDSLTGKTVRTVQSFNTDLEQDKTGKAKGWGRGKTQAFLAWAIY